MAISMSADRVPTHTDQKVNDQIRRATAARVLYYASRSDEIDDRLDELDREWDTERVLETNAALLALAGTVLAGTVHRRFLLLPLAVTGFLLQHGVQGWCPPLPILRRLGVRTPREIETERYALKALRGDFDELPAEGLERAAASFEEAVRPRRRRAQARTDRP